MQGNIYADILPVFILSLAWLTMVRVPNTCEYFSKDYDNNYYAICFLLGYSI